MTLTIPSGSKILCAPTHNLTLTPWSWGLFLFPTEFSGRHVSDLGHLCLLPTAQLPFAHRSPNCHFGGLRLGPRPLSPPPRPPPLASAFLATSQLPLCTPIPPSTSATWKCPETWCAPFPRHPPPHLWAGALSLSPTSFAPLRVTGTELPNSLGHGADLSSKRL